MQSRPAKDTARLKKGNARTPISLKGMNNRHRVTTGIVGGKERFATVEQASTWVCVCDKQCTGRQVCCTVRRTGTDSGAGVCRRSETCGKDGAVCKCSKEKGMKITRLVYGKDRVVETRDLAEMSAASLVEANSARVKPSGWSS